jgi:5'-nucleotidase
MVVIKLDVDSVCADMLPVWIDLYNIQYDDNLDYRAITDWNVAKFVKPECGNKIYDILTVPEFYDMTPPMKGYPEGVARLRELGHTILYVTSCVPGTLDQKLNWILRHDPGTVWQNVVFGYQKSLVRGDLLVDDSPDNLRKASEPTVRFAHPYNYRVPASAHVLSWETMPEAIEGALTDPEPFPYVFMEERWLQTALS